MSTKFAGGVAEDICQVNWNWLYNYSGSGQTFLDLNTVADYLDLSQWDENILNACYVADKQQAVPVSMTGRIFFWNMTTLQKAGLEDYPKTLDDLYAAAETVQNQLGADHYLLYMTGYDRMILMVAYLESIYGKDWADPATSTLNYSREEVAEGLDFIKSLVDRHVAMPLPEYQWQHLGQSVGRMDFRQNCRHSGMGFLGSKISGCSGCGQPGRLRCGRRD